MYEFSVPGQLRTVQWGPSACDARFPLHVQGQGTGTCEQAARGWTGRTSARVDAVGFGTGDSPHRLPEGPGARRSDENLLLPDTLRARPSPERLAATHVTPT